MIASSACSLPDAHIEADGIQHVFVGGDLQGTIRSTGSLTASVGRDFIGTIHTGRPVTNLRVRGDFAGGIRPENKASLPQALLVEKCMPYATLESISEHGYTVFSASVAMSDRAPGLYPEPIVRKRLAKDRHFGKCVGDFATRRGPSVIGKRGGTLNLVEGAPILPGITQTQSCRLRKSSIFRVSHRSSSSSL